MLNLIEDIVGQDYAPAAFWVVTALLAILILWLLVWIVRRMRSGTYVAGGRNRKARLSIMDAAAIDTHRRLVLVRRDDVEHLLLIGGNSDIVVESDIRLVTQSRRPASVVEPEFEEPVARPAPVPAPVPAPAPRPAAPPVAAQPGPRPAPPPAAPRPAAPVVAPVVAPASRVASPVPAKPAPRSRDDLDDDLMKELESALDMDDPAPLVASPKPRTSLDDEMAKLLGELSSQKR